VIAVVGAGIAGLALGLELDRLGAEFVVLEATDRPGGLIRSAEVEAMKKWIMAALALTMMVMLPNEAAAQFTTQEETGGGPCS
jgi:protoporphyrinogen oxidase